MDLLTSKKSKKEDIVKHLGECEADVNPGVGGRYLVEILRSDGSVKSRPFGDEPIKNMILDSFIKYIVECGFRDNYGNGNNYGPGSYYVALAASLMNCSVGGDATPAHRSDLRSEGSLGGGTALKTTYKSTIFNISTSVPNCFFSRDFLFDIETEQSTYREAWVACGYNNGKDNQANVTGNAGANLFSPTYKYISTYGTSRFVFPSPITLYPGDRLKIIYSLSVSMPQVIDGGMPINILNSSFDFSGVIGYSGPMQHTNVTGSPSTNYARIGAVCGVFATNNFYFQEERMVSDSTSIYSYKYMSPILHNISRGSGSGTYSESLAGITTTPYSNFTFNVNPSSRYTITGNSAFDISTYKLTNFSYDDNGGSSDYLYYFPPHTSSRSATGIILNQGENTTYGTEALFLRFNSTQVIPAWVPISLKMRFRINRL